jgi:hypothetical protein
VASELRITGLPRTLSPDAVVQLKAEVIRQGGLAQSCDAAWSVDDGRVAAISASGQLTAKVAGYVTVAAACEGLTGAAETRVETPNPYHWIILAFDKDVPTELGIQATMEFLDGPRAGQSIQTESIFSSGVAGVPWPVKVRFTAADYAPRDFVLSESTGTRRNPTSTLYDFRIPMTFTPDSSTDTYVRTLSRTEMQATHPFVMGVAGDIGVRTWWSVDYNDTIFLELWCGGRMERASQQQFGSAGSGFTQAVAQPGPCEVRVRQLKADAGTHYRIAIRYPH